jgi:hypothetical protein
MKKLLLFAVVLSGIALTSCAKKVDCHCKKTDLLGLSVLSEFEEEHRGTCSELAVEENEKLTNFGTTTTCEEH